MPKRNWKEMDTDELDAPPDWAWTVDDTLAHHAWTQTVNTPEVDWGPDPPILLETLMGFFPDHSMTDALNSWYITRLPSDTYMSETDWEQLPNQHAMSQARDMITDRLCAEEYTPHPLRVKLHSQQYTVNGAMFTYEFTQWQGGDASGMMRVPVPSEQREEAIEYITELPFEMFQMQSRTYRPEWGDGATPSGTYAHPHFRPDGEPTQQEYMELFTRAHEVMGRAARHEALRIGED